MARLILASSSPRRRELLEQLGLVFDIYSPDIDESVQAGESVAHYVERLACAKAEAVQLQYPDAIVIAADTSLGVDQEILGKPVGNDKELEKCTYVSKYGLQGAKKILEEITKEAIEELKEYGDKAEFLRKLALYIKDRNK